MIEHRCQAGGKCVAFTDGPAITPNPLCAACLTSIETKRSRLPALREMLNLFKGGGLRTSAEARVSRSAEKQQPLNMVVYSMIEAINQTALWNQIPTNELDPPDALDMAALHDRAESLLGLMPVFEHRAAPCGNCGESTLGNWSGSDLVQCASCAAVFTRDEYDRSCVAVSRMKEAR